MGSENVERQSTPLKSFFGRTRAANSTNFQPAGHAREIVNVSSQQRGVMGQANGGNLEVHGAGANPKALKVIEPGNGLGIVRKKSQFLQVPERA